MKDSMNKQNVFYAMLVLAIMCSSAVSPMKRVFCCVTGSSLSNENATPAATVFITDLEEVASFIIQQHDEDMLELAFDLTDSIYKIVSSETLHKLDTDGVFCYFDQQRIDTIKSCLQSKNYAFTRSVGVERFQQRLGTMQDFIDWLQDKAIRNNVGLSDLAIQLFIDEMQKVTTTLVRLKDDGQEEKKHSF